MKFNKGKSSLIKKNIHFINKSNKGTKSGLLIRKKGTQIEKKCNHVLAPVLLYQTLIVQSGIAEDLQRP